MSTFALGREQRTDKIHVMRSFVYWSANIPSAFLRTWTGKSLFPQIFFLSISRAGGNKLHFLIGRND